MRYSALIVGILALTGVFPVEFFAGFALGLIIWEILGDVAHWITKAIENDV